MSGSDPKKMEQLPDTTGLKHQILIQKKQRYHYDPVLTVFGAKLIEVGDENGTTEAQLEAAISDQTAAIHYFAPGRPGRRPIPRRRRPHRPRQRDTRHRRCSEPGLSP